MENIFIQKRFPPFPFVHFWSSSLFFSLSFCSSWNQIGIDDDDKQCHGTRDDVTRVLVQ